jgi:uncharacterized protein with HEPN domain
MSERDWRVLAQDILIEADVIAAAIQGRDARTALDEPLLNRALLHALQTIGEAASKMPADIQASMPENSLDEDQGRAPCHRPRLFRSQSRHNR